MIAEFLKAVEPFAPLAGFAVGVLVLVAIGRLIERLS